MSHRGLNRWACSSSCGSLQCAESAATRSLPSLAAMTSSAFVPMLPVELSTDLCSLRPGVDRPVLSALLELDHRGDVVHQEFVRGVIRSAHRMTYTKVHQILEGDEEVRAAYPELTADFELMRDLAMKMNRRREERGSIDFDLPEPVIQFDEHGQMRGIIKAERTWANRLIEEFMLAANECVATWLEDLGVPSLYRIHEKPEPRRVVEFEEIAASFGYSLGLGPLPVRQVETRAERRELRGDVVLQAHGLPPAPTSPLAGRSTLTQ